jgi:Flp pilus assembly protein TadD
MQDRAMPLIRLSTVAAVTLAFAVAPAAGAATPAPAAKPPAAAPTPRPKREKSGAAERAAATRLPPLARAAFWAREVDIDPAAPDPEARLGLARALRDLGKYDEATAAADQLLVLQPGNFEALLEDARSRIAANEGFYAIDSAKRAEAIAPRDWRPVTLLGIAFAQTLRDDEALAALKKAQELAPDNPAVLSNLGLFYATHGQPALAEPLLQRAAASPNATAQERQNLALVLGMKGELAEAEKLERQDLPPDVVDNNLAYFKGEKDSAARTWASLRSDAPGSSQ